MSMLLEVDQLTKHFPLKRLGGGVVRAFHPDAGTADCVLADGAAVAMAPLAIYGAQAEFGLWPEPFGDPGSYGDFYEWMNASWLYMDLGTILAGAVALYFFPFPFIAAITARSRASACACARST